MVEKVSSWEPFHSHSYERSTSGSEKRTRMVFVITIVTMVAELLAGWSFNSMALLADGWHMSSHALALGLATFAYGAARKLNADSRFAFGTWKIEVLAGYTSALMLLGVAAAMAFGSVERVLNPQSIHYQEAIVIAVLGLVVNIVSAFILGSHDGHGHELGSHHHHHHDHHDGHHHDDHAHQHDRHHAHGQPPGERMHILVLNLRSAYVHVLADALTSFLAIIALLGGWFLGLSWLDPLMGIVGAVLVAVWAKGLLVETGKILLDREMDHPVVTKIADHVLGLESKPPVTLCDLHVWRVGKDSFSAAIAVKITDGDLVPEQIRAHLTSVKELVHSTIEIHHTNS
jgi:cation diffusion facilitator family transporter